ncbi:MAG: twin-arginine translocation signal domain-containing protein [Deltaproteobacteria bacterium]|nr:twin-arginine translocation signal domain-containing protein [Deltaproteobacteria bacterium]
MANWKLKDLRDERRRNFLKMCTVAAAAVGIERSKLLNFLADEGGYGLAEAAGATYGRSLLVPSPNGVYAWFQELWPQADMALKAVQNVNIPSGQIPGSGGGALGGISSYLYTMQHGWNTGYNGTYAPGKGASTPSASGVKMWAGGDRPFFYGPHAPWFDHGAGVPKYPVTAFMSGKDETHTEFPVSSMVLSGNASLQAALASLGAASSSAIVPVLGIDPVKYGRAPGAPEVATVPSANGMIDLFNSAASQFTLKDPVDQQLFETYYKALVGLRKSAARSSWVPQMAVTKNAARIIGLNFASSLMPTAQDLLDFGIQEMAESMSADANYMSIGQRNGIEEFGRVLIVVAKAFALGLSKTAIVALSPGPTSETSFTDPHITFDAPMQKSRGRNTTKHLGKVLDGFYNYLSQQVDPESPTEKLDQNTVFVAYGDTPHTPLVGSTWPDATPDSCNWMYVMDPKANIKNGWFGQCYPMKVNGRNGFGFNPVTGMDDPTKTSEQVSAFASTATVFAVARGDKNKTAEYGNSPNIVPGLISSK